jgi:hypothetical protein
VKDVGVKEDEMDQKLGVKIAIGCVNLVLLNVNVK